MCTIRKANARTALYREENCYGSCCYWLWHITYICILLVVPPASLSYILLELCRIVGYIDIFLLFLCSGSIPEQKKNYHCIQRMDASWINTYIRNESLALQCIISSNISKLVITRMYYLILFDTCYFLPPQ